LDEVVANLKEFEKSFETEDCRKEEVEKYLLLIRFYFLLAAEQSNHDEHNEVTVLTDNIVH
jgi:hypothetical protein